MTALEERVIPDNTIVEVLENGEQGNVVDWHYGMNGRVLYVVDVGGRRLTYLTEQLRVIL